MKAVVVEIQNNTAAVLSEEGCIVKVRNHNYQIGQEVDISMKKEFKPKKLLAFGSAAACFALLLGGGAYAYYSPYAYVSLDVNPSIEYSVNVFDKVLSASGVNDDGTAIVNEIDLNNLENKSIEEAIFLTVDRIAKKGYLDSGEGGIVITTSSDNTDAAGKLAQDLQKTAAETIEKDAAEAVVTAEAVGAERVAKARELGVTPGKLNLVEKLMESSADPDSIDMTEWLNKSVKEIMTQTKLNKEQSKDRKQNAAEAVEDQEETQSEENITDAASVETQEAESTSDSSSKKSGDAENAGSNSKKSKNSAGTSSDASAISSTDSTGNGNTNATAAASDNGNGNSGKKSKDR